ncbi:hypothetical protein [Burkholderia pseudomallei]|uniref:Uncharacterized protein n=2 Tax=Burkholderia pseudomallei TaxID=28450 RepID=A0AAX0UG76_BURPE|nr:hypothetical protein [Burkholderia pseudomallei]ABN89356.1 hypothetical protein BURPS1106A_0292 [Burkholderia pseudomallei 1106a]EES27499.1 hypothetical protein BURPS1106B_A3575 [Burkholderia pseudomallei 1106b]AUL56863.1 hypothetical protein BHT10_13960 [Burkholderia pseudomallei]EDO91412.1 hypothetical protein BURPSPAST_Z0647 [Burkholderia pseudomallei Pasteur 52237]EEC32016.1 conserved hypothetical protein [Burkholderia pseudomallei 576]
MSGWAAGRVDRGARGAIARRPLSAIIGARCARGCNMVVPSPSPSSSPSPSTLARAARSLVRDPR